MIPGAALLLAVALICLGAAGRFAVYAPLLLFGPGYLLERWLRPGLPAGARPGVWLALSLATLPLLFLWSTQFGLAITPFRLFLGVVLLTAGLIWRMLPGEAQRDPASQSSARAGARLGLQAFAPAAPDVRGLLQRASHAGLPALVLLVLLGLTGWTRVRHIDGLALPPWVDSVHHALLIRVAAEQGAMPLDLHPYLPIDRLAYHSGYHVVAAALLLASGLPLPTLMLWLGQLLNTLIVLALASCAQGLWRRPTAALVAGLAGGLLSVMPAYYLSWGRYTLLTGLLVLPALLLAIWRLCAAPSWRSVLLAGLLLGGLSLIHFVVLIFALAWGLAALAAAALPGTRRRALISLLVAGVLALALSMPWQLLLLERASPQVGSSPTSMFSNPAYTAMPAELLWASNNRLLLALAALGALLALSRRWRPGAALVLWCALVSLLANLHWLRLPALSFVSNAVVAMALFVPVSLLIAGGAAAIDVAIQRRLRGWMQRSWPLLRGAGLLALALWSALRFTAVVRPDTILAQQDDLQAIAWAAQHTPPDARFLVNTQGWLYRVARGADGGWWLLPLAGRQTSTPPVIYAYGPPAFVAHVQEQTTWLQTTTTQTPAEIAAFMRLNGYTHIYATRQSRLLNPDQLRGSPLFEQLYASERVAIFRLQP